MLIKRKLNQMKKRPTTHAEIVFYRYKKDWFSFDATLNNTTQAIVRIRLDSYNIPYLLEYKKTTIANKQSRNTVNR